MCCICCLAMVPCTLHGMSLLCRKSVRWPLICASHFDGTVCITACHRSSCVWRPYPVCVRCVLHSCRVSHVLLQSAALAVLRRHTRACVCFHGFVAYPVTCLVLITELIISINGPLSTMQAYEGEDEPRSPAHEALLRLARNRVADAVHGVLLRSARAYADTLEGFQVRLI